MYNYITNSLADISCNWPLGVHIDWCILGLSRKLNSQQTSLDKMKLKCNLQPMWYVHDEKSATLIFPLNRVSRVLVWDVLGNFSLGVKLLSNKEMLFWSSFLYQRFQLGVCTCLDKNWLQRPNIVICKVSNITVSCLARQPPCNIPQPGWNASPLY